MNDEEKLNTIREILLKLDGNVIQRYKNGTTNIFVFYRDKILRYKKFVAFKEAVRKDFIMTKNRAKEDFGSAAPTIQEVEDLKTLFFLVKKFDWQKLRKIL